MNLQSQIRDELWEIVRSSYEAEHYTHAIKDAMSFVTEVLRDKSGLDGDGRNLARAALGHGKGNTPKIQVNKLETQTERDIQDGLREVLSGMYALVRNPRTHERVEDDKKTADAVICFIDFLLDYLGESQSVFTVQDFVWKVGDRFFVEDDQYVEALVASVPVRKRADAMIALYREASWEKAEAFSLVLKALIRDATDVEVDHLLRAVSASLENAQRASTVSLVRKLLPTDCWPKLGRVGRLRAENVLIEDLKVAYYKRSSGSTNATAATWLRGIIPHMSLRKPLRDALLDLLKAEDPEHSNFVAKFFFDELPQIFEHPFQIMQCTRAIADSITRGNEYVEYRLQWAARDYPETWYEPLTKALNPVTDPESPSFYLPDGTPLLKGSTVEEEDDIPF